MLEQPLAGQVAVVTGAGRGIGRATAVALAREGADVALIDIPEDLRYAQYAMATQAELRETADLVAKTGRRALVLPADVRDRAAVQHAVERATAELGLIDIAVSNAGLAQFGGFQELSPQAWEEMWQVNVTGMVNVLQAVLPGMRERSHGRVILIGSSAGRQGAAGIAGYSATKWAVNGLAKSVAQEVAADNITVNVVAPTSVRTGMGLNDANLRWISPDDPTPEAVNEAVRTGYNVLPVGQLDPDDIADAVLLFTLPHTRLVTGVIFDAAAGANARWTA